MPILKETARQARILKYRGLVMAKLNSQILRDSNMIYTDKGIPFNSLKGEVILAIERDGDGNMIGVHSATIDNISAIIPDLKADIGIDNMGWKRHLDGMKSANNINLIEDIDAEIGIDDPDPDEYEPST